MKKRFLKIMLMFLTLTTAVYGQSQESMIIEKTDGTTLEFDINDIKQMYFFKEKNSDFGQVADAVDLGLSVDWASWNLGASAIGEYGGLYGWADPTGQLTSKNLSDYPSSTPPTDICGTDYDIAHVVWGEDWRLPSADEISELIEKCKWNIESMNGKTCIKVVGPNGNHIILPLGGSRSGTEVQEIDEVGLFISGTLYQDDSRYAHGLMITQERYGTTGFNRALGCSVRPVRTKSVLPPAKELWVKYDSGKESKLVRYNHCYIEGGNSINAYTTNWRQTEEDLMNHPGLANPLSRNEFEQHYNAQYTISGIITDLDQYYIQNEAAYLANPANVTPIFQAVTVSNPKIGNIAYDMGVGAGLGTSFLKWDIDALEITDLASRGVTSVTRAILLKSDDPVNYPDMYVIFKSGAIKVDDKTVTANMNVTAKRIAEYWYKNVYPSEKGTEEIRTCVVTPEENKGVKGAPFLDWKPKTFENRLSNVFHNNFNSGTFASWMTFKGAPTTAGQPFKAANTKLSIIFDNSNNGAKMYGKLDAGAAKEFTISNTTIGDVTKKNLYASYGGKTQRIAYIDGSWDGTNADVLNLQDVKVVLDKTDYAKALLNYVDHFDISQSGVLSATVAVVPTTQSGTDALVYSGSQIRGAIKYYDGQTVRYCPLEVEDYKFNVRFLRPVSINTNKEMVIENATSSTSDPLEIHLDSFISEITDFRNDSKYSVNWKTQADGIDYEEYYAPEGKDRFVISIPGINAYDYISSNPNVLTNFNQSDPNIFVPLSTFNNIDFQLIGSDKLIMINNTNTDQEFRVKIPIEIEYYWGTLNDEVILKVKPGKVVETIFEEPYLTWGVSRTVVKSEMASRGFVLAEESNLAEQHYMLLYDGKHKEVMTVCFFNDELKLDQVVLAFDASVVSVNEIRNSMTSMSYMYIGSNDAEAQYYYMTSDGKTIVIVDSEQLSDELEAVYVYYMSSESLSGARQTSGNQEMFVDSLSLNRNTEMLMKQYRKYIVK